MHIIFSLLVSGRKKKAWREMEGFEEACADHACKMHRQDGST